MVEEDTSIEDLEKARDDLIQIINDSMTEVDKAFLVSFKSMIPDWSLLDGKNIENMPAVKWKQHNLKKMDPLKHNEALEKLKQKLYKSQ